jgi:hypothetical protein
VVWGSAAVLASFFFFFSFCASAGEAIEKKIAMQTTSVKSVWKLRTRAGTAFAAI